MLSTSYDLLVSPNSFGAIVCRDNTTVLSTLQTISGRGWNQVFTGLRTHLRIENIAGIRTAGDPQQVAVQYELPRAQLEGALSLDLSCSPDAVNRKAGHHIFMALSYILPNLRHLDASNLIAAGRDYCFVLSLCHRCRHLNRITWKGSSGSVDVLGHCLRPPSTVTELNLDHSKLRVPLMEGNRASVAESFQSANHHESNYHLFSHCNGIERLSIKTQFGFFTRNNPFPSHKRW